MLAELKFEEVAADGFTIAKNKLAKRSNRSACMQNYQNTPLDTEKNVATSCAVLFVCAFVCLFVPCVCLMIVCVSARAYVFVCLLFVCFCV